MKKYRQKEREWKRWAIPKKGRGNEQRAGWKGAGNGMIAKRADFKRRRRVKIA